MKDYQIAFKNLLKIAYFSQRILIFSHKLKLEQGKKKWMFDEVVKAIKITWKYFAIYAHKLGDLQKFYS